MKQKMSLIDVAAIVADLTRVCSGGAVKNIYNLNARTFVLRLQSKRTGKAMLLFESGVRIHPTEFEREKPQIPSGFVSKLRKHVRGKVLNSVAQLGMDRVVDLCFGIGESECHIIVEMYAGGNVILADADWKILSLLRTVALEVSSGDAVGTGTKVALQRKNVGKRGGKKPSAAAAAAAAAASKAEAEEEEEQGPQVSEWRVGEPYPLRPGVAEATESSPPVRLEGVSPVLTASDLLGLLEGWSSREVSSRKERKGAALKLTLVQKEVGTQLSSLGPNLVEHAVLRAWASFPLPGGVDPSLPVCRGGDWSTQVMPLLRAEDGNPSEWMVALATELQIAYRGLAAFEADSSWTKGGFLLARLTDEALSAWRTELGAAEEGTPVTIPHPECGYLSVGESISREVVELLEWDDFSPVMLQQHTQWTGTDSSCRLYSGSRVCIRLAGAFFECVDRYFVRHERERAEARAEATSKADLDRVERLREKQELAVRRLQAEEGKAKLRAAAIEHSSRLVEAALTVLRSALESGMDWTDLERRVKSDSDAGNPVARAVAAIDMSTRQASLRLPIPPGFALDDDDAFEEEDEDGPSALARGSSLASALSASGTSVTVPVDILQTAAGNVSTWYAKAKAARAKGERTVDATTVALKRVEKEAAASADKAKRQGPTGAATIVAVRKPAWFEKFAWFVTSDGLVVCAGRDMQQNEILVRRYLRPQDAYVHADVHGAASCVVRSPMTSTEPAAGIPPRSLVEAGAFAVCRSAAWKAGTAASAWWVEASQVSKSAPSGEYLPTGSFMIRGKKNPLPLVKLELGLAICFKLERDSVLRRLAAGKLPAARTVAGYADDSRGKPAATAAERELDATPEDDGEAPEARGGSKVSAAAKRRAKRLIADSDGELRKEEALRLAQEAIDRQAVSQSAAEPAQDEAAESHAGKSTWDAVDDEDDELMRIALGHAPSKQQSADSVPLEAPAGPKPLPKQRPRTDDVDDADDEDDEEEQDEDLEALLAELPMGVDPAAASLALDPRVVERKETPGEEAAAPAADAGLGDAESETLLYALPVVLPWSCCSHAKWVVRLQPGNGKRGKVGKEAMSIIASKCMRTGTERELALIRRIPDDLLMLTMVGDVRIGDGGGKASGGKKAKGGPPKKGGKRKH
jgi:predicted ribosome quality control (RQC) complex YloA/Tae2 family protein